MAQGNAYPLDAFRMPPPLVTTLPTSPIDGDEVYYLADVANSRIWHLRYRADLASIYKWEFLGGHPLRATRSVLGETYNAGGFGDPTTPGPLLTAPLAGDYRCGIHWSASHTSAAAFGVAAVKVGAAATLQANGVYGQNGVANGNWASTSTVELNVPAAATVLKVQYLSGSGATMTLNNAQTGPAWLEAVPVRVA